MPHQRTISSAWMRGIADTLSAHQLDASSLFKEAGLAIANLDDCDFRWPTEGISRLWSIAAERSRNPDIGLFNRHTARPDQYGLAGYAMMSSPSIESGLVRLTRYNRLVSNAAIFTLEPGVGGKWMRLELFGGDCPIPRQRYDHAIVTLLTFCRWTLGRPLKPLAVSFRHPSPTSLAAYDDAFAAPLQFDAPFSGFLISDEDLACKLPTSSPELADLHDRLAGQALLKLERSDVSHRARNAVVRHLPDGAPQRSVIAVKLNMSDHTFQRRLAAEGTSFTELVDDVRRELTQHHLADTKLSLSEIAYLLGYADQSTFFRASNRWFGESPGEYRVRLTAGHAREVAEARPK
jgi:AraC-like DNA-binding protein